MSDFLRDLLANEGFHPHGYCYLWQPGLLWLHAISDALIGLAYVAIGMTLAFFVRRGRGEIPFSRIFVAFGVFIAACGATHFMEIWTLWDPVYWLAGSVKVVTAAASVLTAMVLPPLVPIALGTIRTARLSDRRKDELERTNGELAAAHEELAQLYHRLKEAGEAKTRFFANVSHELRTPLALILGPTERLLADEATSTGQRQQIESIQRNAGLLLQHVNDLLDVQKLEAGQMPMRYARVDLAGQVRFWSAYFESAAAGRDIELLVATPPALPAEVDADKIGRVVLNLLSNALKFTPAGGRVRCVLHQPEDGEGDTGRTRLEVHDSGPGIPEHQRQVVFEPFRQGDETDTRRHAGTGLGLAIVREFVQLHGGDVTIDDSPEGGTLVSVELPVRAPAGTEVEEEVEFTTPLSRPVFEAAEPTEDLSAPGTHTDTADADRPLVLVVEDNPDMNAFIQQSLIGSFRVAAAHDGRQGLEAAKRLRPDLILSDIMMPELSGDALVRELRGMAEMNSTPIVLLSARADVELRINLLSAGAQDYLTKPFSVEELLARVQNWTAMKRAGDVLRRELDSTVEDLEALARQLANRSRELDAALSTTRLALEEAEEASRVKSDFLSVMSHELRTPLNAIVGYTELLEMEAEAKLSAAEMTRIAKIKASADHLLRLIEEVLLYARTDSERAQVMEENFDLSTTVQESVEMLTELAAQKGLTLELVSPEEPVWMRSDPQKIRQIVINLVGNAIKFTDQGQVSVVVQSQPDAAVLRVRDSGPGIRAEHRDRIFEPFWQADASKTRRYGGTGLGLSIVRKLVELLGGGISVESEPGRGSQFTVRLPLVSNERDR
jgi:signal transduction histidine kinase